VLARSEPSCHRRTGRDARSARAADRRPHVVSRTGAHAPPTTARLFQKRGSIAI
jgi:hypothetical protein